MEWTNKDVMDLRKSTGVGMMDCKKALAECDGNMEKAIEYLREKGIAKAAKKADRIAAEGIVDSYIHMGGKVGVLLEVNCETDFVSRGDKFKELVHDIALHIAASNPQYLCREDVPESIVEKEKEILLAQIKEDPKFASKPEKVLATMIEGKIGKFFEENCLLDQKFVKDPSKTISGLVTDAVASIGEKISVRRFVRYEMGEGLEKRQDNFAEEINAQMAKKA